MNAVSTLIFRGKDRVSGGASISQVIRIAPLAEPKSHRTKNFISGNHPLENEARFEHPQKASGVVEKEQRSIIRENFYDRKSKRGENFDSLYPGERQIDSSSSFAIIALGMLQFAEKPLIMPKRDLRPSFSPSR